MKMIYHDRIGVSDETDVNKISAWKDCLSLNYSFKFQPNICNRCHVLLIISVNLSDIAILSIKGSDFCCIVSLISKNEAINLL